MNQSDLDVLIHVFGEENVVVLDGGRMNGTVARVLADKKFGFIRGEDGKDYFFHMSDLNGFFDDLVADNRVGHTINVTFEPTESKKGLRAAEVQRTDGGVG